MKRSLLAMSMLLAAIGCKSTPKTSSDVESLTQEELKDCSFKGKRFFIMFAPDFLEDINFAQELFVPFHSDTQMVHQSYLENKLRDDPACRNYYYNEISKYQEFAVVAGPNATYDNFLKKMADLKKAIKNYRETAGADAGEVQIVLLHDGHGTNNGLEYTDGSVLFHGTGNGVGPDVYKYVNFRDYVSVVYENLFTKCGTDCKNPQERIADEIILNIDTCYSGNLNDQFRNYLAGVSYPVFTKSIDSKATRIFSMSTSNLNHTSTGAFQSTGAGTTVHILKEVFDYWNADRPEIGNNDSFISFGEVWNYFDKTAFMRFAPAKIDLLQQEVFNKAVCTDTESKKAVLTMLENEQRYVSNLYADPLKAMVSDTHTINAKNDFAMAMTLQIPTMYSNLSPALLNTTYVAVKGKSEQPTDQGANQIKMLLDPVETKAVKEKITNYVAILHKVHDYLKTNTEAGVIDSAKLNFTPAEAGLKATYETILNNCVAASKDKPASE